MKREGGEEGGECFRRERVEVRERAVEEEEGEREEREEKRRKTKTNFK